LATLPVPARNVRPHAEVKRTMTARRYPPGPSTLAAFRGLSPTGNLQRIPGFLAKLARDYGPVASWRMPPGRRFWFLDDPALIESMLTASGFDVVKGRGLQRMRRLLGEGLLTSDEPLHLRQRRLVQPAFHRERVAGYAATMIAAARAAADGLSAGETVAVDALMNRLALRIAAATLFSADVDDDADTIGAALTETMAVFPASLSAFGELIDHLPFHPTTRRFAAARAELDRVIFRLIAERRRDGVDRGDLLSILLTSDDGDGAPMPDTLVRDEALTLLLAGHETTANTLTWTWDALARTPAAEQRLHAELDAVLGDRDPVPDDVPKLRFTRDVVAESMRLRPPAWILGRRVIRPSPGDVGPCPRLGDTGVAIDHPPEPALLDRAGRIPSGTLVERRDGRAPEVRLLPLRRRQPHLHWRELRLDRSRPAAGHARATRALPRARPFAGPARPAGHAASRPPDFDASRAALEPGSRAVNAGKGSLDITSFII